MKKHKLVMGLDLGRQSDYTVLSVIHDNSKINGSYDLIYLKKYKLKTSYVTIVRDIKNIIDSFSLLRGSPLVVDATGVGRPVVDMFNELGCNIVAVTITGGHNATFSSHGDINVPKKEIVSSLQVSLQNKKLKIASDISGLNDIKRELLNFKTFVTSHNTSTYSASSGYHDDIVLSIGLAIWYLEFIRSGHKKVRVSTGS